MDLVKDYIADVLQAIDKKFTTVESRTSYLATYNWADWMSEFSAEIYEQLVEQNKGVGIFPAVLREQAFELAQEKFSAMKARGEFDELNCHVV